MFLRFQPFFAHAPADAGGGGGTGTGEGEELETETEDLETGDDAGEEKDTAAEKAAADKDAADAKAKADADAKAKAEKDKAKGKEPKKGLLAGAAKDEKGAKSKDGQGDGAKGKKGAEGDQGDDLAKWAPKLPDGQKADEELLGELKGFAKERGLKGEDLQRVVDLGVKMQAKVTQGFLEAHDATVSKYEAETKADKEIGGAKLADTLQNGLAVLKHFAGNDYDAVISELERTGLGSNRAVLATLNRIHAATLKQDDTASRARAGGAGATPTDGKGQFARKMYPKMMQQLEGEDGD